jgi:hypothetical protein
MRLVSSFLRNSELLSDGSILMSSIVEIWHPNQCSVSPEAVHCGPISPIDPGRD